MAALRPLEEKLQKFHIASRTCDHVFKHTLIQAQRTERQIRDQFEELHRFLREEEEARIAAVREEEEQKSRMMKEKIEQMKGEISSLSDTMKAALEQLEAEDVAFLQAYEDTMKRVWGAPQTPEKVPGALIDVTKHLGNLKYRVWEKMLGTVQYTPVILDPNTAGPSLSLSDDLTWGRGRGEEGAGPQRGPIPDNPERFGPYACALGWRGFASGRHSWQVDVGGSTGWTVGVAAGSVRRKERFSACPEEGVWALSLRDGAYRATDAGRSAVAADGRLRRLRVELDWDGGRVTFSDPAEARGSALYTFSHPFTQRVYPYFESPCAQQPLRILAEKVSVRADEDSAGEDLT